MSSELSSKPINGLIGGLIGGLRIGLLGGSFNPAHEGHRHISLVALRRLQLHQVWWLVSPQNPLKPQKGMAPFAQRMKSAQTMADHPAIRVTDIETQMGTRYTADTIRQLTDRAHGTNFVWLMGADNLLSFPKWHKWTSIMDRIPVAVIARPGYSLKARMSHAANRYAHRQFPVEHASRLADAKAPAWVFYRGPADIAVVDTDPPSDRIKLALGLTSKLIHSGPIAVRGWPLETHNRVTYLSRG